MIFGRDVRPDSATGSEGSHDLHPAGLRDGHQIVQNQIGDVFVKRTVIPVLLQVEFQRLQFEAELIGNVGDRQRPEIRLAGFRTDGSEFRTDRFDLVISVRKLIGKRLQCVAKALGHRCGSIRTCRWCLWGNLSTNSSNPDHPRPSSAENSEVHLRFADRLIVHIEGQPIDDHSRFDSDQIEVD